MHAPRTAPPMTSLPRLSRLDAAEGPRPVWLWRGSGPALTPRGLVPLRIEGAAPAVMTPHGPGLRIERGTTNLVTNPSFEVDLSGWSAVAGATIARETAGGAFGAAYAHVEVASTGHGIRVTGSGNAAQGDTYTASMYLRAATPADVGKTVQVYLDAPGGTYEIFATDHVLTEAWTRVVLPATWAQSGHTGWGVIARSAIPQGAFSFVVDGAQYESGEVTSYADGSLGTGYAWDGGAHSSTSQRAGATVRASALSSTHGVRMSVVPAWAAGDGYRHVVVDFQAAPGLYACLAAEASGDWQLTLGWGDSTATVGLPQTHFAGEVIDLVASWGRGIAGIEVNGTRARVPSIRPLRLFGFTLGANASSGTEQLGGAVCHAAVWGR